MKLAILIAVLVAIVIAPVYAEWGIEKTMNLSVFAAMDKGSDESGYGASLAIHEAGITDLSFVDMDSFRFGQFAKLDPKQFGSIPVFFGFAVGYVERKDDVSDQREGLHTGLELMTDKYEIMNGFSLSLRIASLSKDFDPVAWFTDPDILWAGAGLAYEF